MAYRTLNSSALRILAGNAVNDLPSDRKKTTLLREINMARRRGKYTELSQQIGRRWKSCPGTF